MTEQAANTTEPQATDKLTYQKPEVTEIELVAFDVLGNTCAGGQYDTIPCQG